MPWCPRCDEVFPEGPTCPRCRSALADTLPPGRSDESLTGALPQIEVPRRLRRALGVRPADPAPPRPLVALALALVLFAGGFVVGRMSTLGPDSPALRVSNVGLAAGAPGSLVFVRYGIGIAPPDFEVARNGLSDSRVEPMSRFSSPFQLRPTGAEEIDIVSMAGSVALSFVAPDGRGAVAAFPLGRRPTYWLDGSQAGWLSRTSLVVRDGEKALLWNVEEAPSAVAVPGRWTDLQQTAAGVFTVGDGAAGHGLYEPSAEPKRVMELPADAELIAVAPRATQSLVAREGGLELWDGAESTPVQSPEGMAARAATFSMDGKRLAVVLSDASSAGSVLAIFDQHGAKVALRPVPDPDEPHCRPRPSFDAAGHWVFLAPGNGSVHGIEIGGATRHAAVRALGCSVAWSG